MKAITAEGVVTEVGTEEVFSDKFKKKNLFLKVKDGDYSDEVVIEFINNNVPKLKDINVGDSLSVKFDVRGKRNASGKVFVSLAGFMVTKK